METLGSYLKGERETLGISLEQVAASTKVRASLLRELEADHLEGLPGGIFLRGFVRAYAASLHLRPDHALALLDGQTGHGEEGDRDVGAPVVAGPHQRTYRLTKAHALLLVLVLLSLLGGYLAMGYSQPERTGISAVQTTDATSGTARSFSPLTGSNR